MKKISYMLVISCTIALLCGCSTLKNNTDSSKETPTVVTIWNYYNGAQKETFDRMVQDFNNTLGLEKGIVVEAISKGTIKELGEAITASLAGQVGAPDIPDAVAVYSDTAFELNKEGKTVDLSNYMTQEELAEYVDAYMEEGDFGDGFKLFPIAKSTEVLAINQTDWQVFAGECEIEEESLSTWEGIAKTAELYYKWTDSQTPEKEDGKALFGRDAFANYMIIGSKQLGHEIFNVKDGTMVLDFDKETMRKLWDNYYIPFINGYYGSFGKFRSDDVKTGKLIGIVCSSSGVTYLPNAVTLEDGTNYEIQSKLLPLPNFEGTKPLAVQQGAGILVMTTGKEKETAAIEFLKWFTDVENNIEFSLNSGYLPVKKAAVSWDAFERVVKERQLTISDTLSSSVKTGLNVVTSYDLYTTKPFKEGTRARAILNDSMELKAQEDRKIILEMMEKGTSKKDAVGMYDNDMNFETWYETTLEQLKQLGGNDVEKK